MVTIPDEPMITMTNEVIFQSHHTFKRVGKTGYLISRNPYLYSSKIDALLNWLSLFLMAANKI